MRNVTILGVDPGKTTGLAWFRGDAFVVGDEARGGIEGLRTTLEHGQIPDIVVMENFLGGYGNTANRYPLMVIGGTHMWAEEHGIEVEMQSPAILRKRLKEAAGLHRSKHVRCAAAHVLHYLQKEGNGVG